VLKTPVGDSTTQPVAKPGGLGRFTFNPLSLLSVITVEPAGSFIW
jgi:hypothetical protein